MKKYNYYKVNAGFYPDIIKVCFDDKVFQQILLDHGAPIKANALLVGAAETHLIEDGKHAIIVVAIGMDVVNGELCELVDTIAHEICHVIDHLADYIGEEDGFVGETRAYLTGHLAKQILKICLHEKFKNAGKTSRKSPKQKGEGTRGYVSEMDQLNKRGAGPIGVLEQARLAGGTEDPIRSFIRTSETHFRAAEPTRLPSNRSSVI